MAITWTPRQLALVIGSVVAAGAIGAAAVFVGLHRSGPSASPNHAAAAVELRVTGKAPAAAGPFAGGAKLAWRDDTAKLGLGEVDNQLNYLGGDEQTWVVTGNGATSSGSADRYVIGLNVATGEQRWRTTIEGSASYSCAAQLIDGSLACMSAASYNTSANDIELQLVSLADGSVTKRATLAELGFPAGPMSPDTITVFNQDIVVDTIAGSMMVPTMQSGTLARIPASLTAATWVAKTAPPCLGNGAWPRAARLTDGLLFLTDPGQVIAADYATGTQVFGGGCAFGDAFGGAGKPVIAISGSGDPAAAPGTLSNGTAVPILDSQKAGDGALLVDFESSDAAPPLPLFFTEKSDGSVSVMAYHGQDASPAWAAPVSSIGSPRGGTVAGTYADGRLALVDTAGHVTSVDPSSGAVRWTSSYDAPERRNDTLAEISSPQPRFLPDGTLLVSDGIRYATPAAPPSLSAFDPTTGKRLWTLGDVQQIQAPAPSAEAIPVWAVGSVIGAVVPTDPPSTAPSRPAGVPKCPSAQQLVSWTVFAGGHIAVCDGKEAGTGWVDYVRGNQKTPCSRLDFADFGYSLTCGSDRIAVSDGASVVTFHTSGGDWVQAARQAWARYTAGESHGFGQAAPRIKTICPEPQLPIGLATWSDGSLLVCGTSASAPGFFAYSDAGSAGSGSPMTLQDGALCGSTSDGVRVCQSSDRATVTLTPSGGAAKQRTVTASYPPIIPTQ